MRKYIKSAIDRGIRGFLRFGRTFMPERLRIRADERLSQRPRGYHFYCHKCGHGESFKTPERYRQFKAQHKCVFVTVENPRTGFKYNVRKQLADRWDELESMSKYTRQRRHADEKEISKFYKGAINRYLKKKGRA